MAAQPDGVSNRSVYLDALAYNDQGREVGGGEGLLTRWIRLGLEWWGRNWLRFQMVATPLGSLLLTLWLSQVENVGWFWNSQAEFEVAAKFASGGILFYTASFAALETGVIIVVLGLQIYKKFEEDRDKRRREQLERGAALALEAQRLSQETGEPYEEILRKLISETKL